MTMSWFTEAPKARKWLVGVSGGADSVALLHLLVEHGFQKLVVCHLDHRLRGKASTGDAKFVEQLAGKLGLQVEIGRAEVKALAKENKQSLETAARHARHAFFEDCAKRHRCQRVILAHHADDQAETVLWNLLRGSHGLRGMKVVQFIDRLEIHRPLLKWRREDLKTYLSSNRLLWREDATNTEPIAVRNRLRNEVLPLLAEVSGRDPVAALERELAHWDDSRSITEWALKKADVIDPQGRLHLKVLRDLPPALQRAAIADYLRQRKVAFDQETLERAHQLIETTDPSVVNLPNGLRFRRRAGRLFVGD